MISNVRLQETLEITVAGLEHSLIGHLPHCAYQDYCAWAVSEANPQRETWLHVMGIPQFVSLTLNLFEGVIPEPYMAAMLKVSVPVNVYLMYEVVSDDLAIGLARRCPDDPIYERQHRLLREFNRAAVKRLIGSTLPTEYLLEPVRALAEQISGFEQSLVPEKHRAMVRGYLAAAAGRVAASDVEYSLWPRLIANVETCVQVARLVEDLRIGPVVREGLIRRYLAVDSLLDNPVVPLTRRLGIGADAILVVPTLAYYIGVLAEQVMPLEGLGVVIADGSLEAVLNQAALLVRLLNDVGPRLLLDPEQPAAFVSGLKARLNGHNPSLAMLLMENLEQFRPLMTRLHKDLFHGEFNVSLDGLADRAAAQALANFETRLVALGAVYRTESQRLARSLDVLAACLGDETVSRLIGRFVSFHEALYASAHTDEAGEYTV